MPWLLVLPVATVLFGNLPSAPAAGGASVVPSPVEAPPAAPETRWYGDVTLVADGIAAGGVALAGIHESDLRRRDGSHSSITAPAIYTLTAVYLLDGPLVHVLHRRPGRAAGRLLLRAGTVAVGLAILVSVSESAGCSTDSFPHASSCDWVAAAFVMSPVAAFLIDDLLLAREPVVKQPAASALSPRIVVQPGLALFGMGGTF